MNRRSFLAGTATIMAIPVSGCTEFLPQNVEGVLLTHVILRNGSGEPQVFDLLVTLDEEIIHWAAHEVGVGETDQEMGESVIDIDNPDDFYENRGHLEVFVRVGDEWGKRADFDTDNPYDGNPVYAVVEYGMDEDDVLRISRGIADVPT